MRVAAPRLLVPAVVAAGALLAVQGRVNGELGHRMHSAVDAATVSFLGGTLLLAVVVGVARRPAVRRLRRAETRWWWWLGGLAGAAVVSATAAGVPEIGIALVSVCIVAGTTAGALAVDELALGPGGRHRISRSRAAGALLAVVAVLLGAIGDRHASLRPLLFAALFAAGAASALQQAANGWIRHASSDAPVASLVSFTGGTMALLVAAAAGGGLSERHWPSAWWLYTGGAAGAVYIALAAYAVQSLGVLRLSLATVAGQLLGSVVIDACWPAPGTSLHATTVLGALLTLAAVALAGADAGNRAPGGRGRGLLA